MVDGNYYMDGECFIRVKRHFVLHNDEYDDTSMIRADELNFRHGLGYYEDVAFVEEACDSRMVPSSKEEFEMVKNLYDACHAAIDRLNTEWFMPRWAEKQKTK